jgi:hypothetical protein
MHLKPRIIEPRIKEKEQKGMNNNTENTSAAQSKRNTYPCTRPLQPRHVKLDTLIMTPTPTYVLLELFESVPLAPRLAPSNQGCTGIQQ